MNYQWLSSISWEAIDALLNLIELLIMCVPACIVFLYYRVKSLTIWPQEITPNGTIIIIHNETNKSVFITDMSTVSKKSPELSEPIISWDKKVIQLKSDEHTEVTINYTKTSSKRQSFKLIVKYNRNKRKAIRVKV